jgi:outer membrane protein insertion porin family
VVGRISDFLLIASVATLIGIFSNPVSLGAQSSAATEIRIEGSQRIEADTIRSYVPIADGDKITSKAMDSALKRLFATGLFADVTVRREGNIVVITVVENPIINRIVFEGNKRIESEALQDEVKLKSRVVYTRSRVQNDVQRLIDVYQRNGRYAATVEPKVIQLPQNRIDLIFEITEGPVTQIRRVSFLGNKHFKDSDLRSVIQTKESAWYRFLSSDDNYDPDRLAFDRELLRRFYLSRGYADFRIVSSIAELAPNRKGFFITFTIEEGNRYQFGNVNVSAKLSGLSNNKLEKHIKIKNGDWYNADAIQNVILKLTNVVGTLGYAFVNIRPKVERDKKRKLIGITFEVLEGPRVFVERIDITGNSRTIDPVIRREITLVEGDAFNSSKMRQTRKKIRNLGFFEKIEVKTKRGSKPDQTVLDVKVREQSTGSVSFGLGFSSASGAMGDFSIRERNLLGRGHDLLLKTTVSADASQVDLRFTDPYFLDRNLSAGIDLFQTAQDLQDESSFEKESLGAGLRFGFKYSDKLKQKLSYRVSRDEVTDVKASASLAIKEQAGAAVKSMISQSLSFDSRDDRFQPTEGTIGRFTTDIAGFGGSVKFIRADIIATKYLPITEDVIGSFRGSLGYIVGLGEDVRIIDRFFLGGSNLRGFKAGGAGPRDESSEDSVGGKLRFTSSAQLTFPLGLPNELGIKGRMFTDIGGLTDAESSLATIKDEKSIRASIGFGLSWRSPFGPIVFDFSKALLKKDFDKTETIRLDLGARF